MHTTTKKVLIIQHLSNVFIRKRIIQEEFQFSHGLSRV